MPHDPRDAALSAIEVFCESRIPEELRAEIRLECSRRGNSITIVDDPNGEFAPDATSNPWPASFPTTMLGGTKLKLGITLTPSGNPGVRRARLRVITSQNDTFYVNITGEAGTRSIAANPTSLFDGANIIVGSTARQVLSILGQCRPRGHFPVVCSGLRGRADLFEKLGGGLGNGRRQVQPPR